MRKIAVLSFLVLGVPLASGGEMAWRPGNEEIARLEKGLKLPQGAHPISEYARYYWGVSGRDGKVIRGVFVFGERIGSYVVDKPPHQFVTDQGCNRIFVFYHTSGNKVSALCDGVG